MKIEIKLKSHERCNGCPLMLFRRATDKILMERYCALSYLPSATTTNYNEQQLRPDKCKQENGL
jgi:hypothetical protein